MQAGDLHQRWRIERVLREDERGVLCLARATLTEGSTTTSLGALLQRRRDMPATPTDHGPDAARPAQAPPSPTPIPTATAVEVGATGAGGQRAERSLPVTLYLPRVPATGTISAMGRFQRAHKELSPLRDPHLVATREVRAAPGSITLLVDPVPERTLADAIETTGAPSLREGLAVVQQLLPSLVRARALGWRLPAWDPARIYLEPDGTCRILALDLEPAEERVEAEDIGAIRAFLRAVLDSKQLSRETESPVGRVMKRWLARVRGDGRHEAFHTLAQVQRKLGGLARYVEPSLPSVRPAASPRTDTRLLRATLPAPKRSIARAIFWSTFGLVLGALLAVGVLLHLLHGTGGDGGRGDVTADIQEAHAVLDRLARDDNLLGDDHTPSSGIPHGEPPPRAAPPADPARPASQQVPSDREHTLRALVQRDGVTGFYLYRLDPAPSAGGTPRLALIRRYEGEGAVAQRHRDAILGWLRRDPKERAPHPLPQGFHDAAQRHPAWRIVRFTCRGSRDALLVATFAPPPAWWERMRSPPVLALLLLAASAVAYAVAALVSRWALAPLRVLGERAAAVSAGAEFEPVPAGAPDEIGRLATAFNRMAAMMRERDAIRAVFMDDAPRALTERVLADRAREAAGDEAALRRLALLYWEPLPCLPEADAALPAGALERLYRHALDAIRERGGIVQRIGPGGLIGLFQDPRGHGEAEEAALRAALELANASARSDGAPAADAPSIDARIAVHAGSLLVQREAQATLVESLRGWIQTTVEASANAPDRFRAVVATAAALDQGRLLFDAALIDRPGARTPEALILGARPPGEPPADGPLPAPTARDMRDSTHARLAQTLGGKAQGSTTLASLLTTNMDLPPSTDQFALLGAVLRRATADRDGRADSAATRETDHAPGEADGAGAGP